MELNFNLHVDKDGTKWIECEQLGLYGAGKTWKKAFKDAGEDFEFLLESYGRSPDAVLSEGAQKLKEMVLDIDYCPEDD